ncbi:hypothetical protein BGW39_003333, partial [Mortierella sp. 14UC]
GFTQSIIDSQLTIVKGDIADLPAIKYILINNTSNKTGSVKVAWQIISGISDTPQIRMSFRKPIAIDNPEICAIATKNIIQALQEIYSAHPSTARHKPSVTVIDHGVVFRGTVIVRPSLLKSDKSVKSGKGWLKLKVGVESKSALGYTCHRADVGQWIHEQTVKTGGEGYFGQRVTFTN